MFKYEKYIGDFLQQAKEVSLEKIGVFFLIDEMVTSETSSSTSYQKINFQFDKRALTSESFLLFVTEKEQKNKLIVSLDTESYLYEIRQLVNTGKTVSIEGLGKLELNKTGEYEFMQDTNAGNKQEDGDKRKNTAHRENISKRKTKERKNDEEKASKNFFPKLALILLIAAACGYAVYYFAFKTKSTIHTPALIVSEDSATDSSKQNIIPANQAPIINTDSVTYKFIFETTQDSSRAYARTEQLQRFGDPAYLDSMKKDTITYYSLYVIKKINPADSATVKDSIQKYFQRDIIMEKIQ